MFGKQLFFLLLHQKMNNIQFYWCFRWLVSFETCKVSQSTLYWWETPVTARPSNSSCSQNSMKRYKFQEVSKRSNWNVFALIYFSLILMRFQRQWSQISKFYLQPCGRWMQRFFFNCVLSRPVGEAENVKIVMKPSVSGGWYWLILCQQNDGDFHPLHLPGVPPSHFVTLFIPGTGLFPEAGRVVFFFISVCWLL